ncbi:GNAT family N-acetyltransferase [Dethiothermospora halolimnae]|uniref:GNAT family N-acetyltransferase n=1 Tax=Dethiothermospora halolimnae TaxID=3114390 RepID=UPI003CCBE7B0
MKREEIRYNIYQLKDINNIPYNLLLSADPSEEAIRDYIKRGFIYICEINEIIGVYVLINTRPNTMELVNISVKENFQGKGIGKQLVLHAINTAIDKGIKTLEIGTGNSSLDQLALYQKCGFRIVGVDKDFFIRHYAKEIIENGIKCRDMIRLSMDLDSYLLRKDVTI